MKVEAIALILPQMETFCAEPRLNSRSMKNFIAIVFALSLVIVLTNAEEANAASDLMLSPALSFTDDSSPNFPIQAKDLADGTIAPDRPTIVFFGTSNCWNTAREAERLVELYPKYRSTVNFVVVDLNHSSPEQKVLAAKYYRGYIPTITILKANGQVVYDRAGETATRRGDASNLDRLISSAVATRAK